jgi:hypothetical protein
MQFWRALATTAAVVLVLAPSARADTFHVSPTGDDEQDPAICTAEAPCSMRVARITANLTPDEDTIVIPRGEYALSPDELFTEPVVLEGVRGDRPTLKGGRFEFAAQSTLRDVSIVGTAQVVLRAVSSHLERVDVTNGPLGTSTNAVCALEGPDSVIADSACHASPEGFGANAIELGRDGDGDFTIRHVTALSGGAAINAYSFGAVNAAVSDSILAGAINLNGATALYDNSASTTSVLPGAGNLRAALETIFPNIALGGVRPGAGSPTIDAGAASGDADLDGNPRTLGTAPDMGALEWIPVAPAVATGDPIAISTGGAVVSATIDPGGALTTFRVEYGPAGGGYTGAVDGGSAGAGTLGSGFQATIGGLAPGSAYHYRVVASNAAGAGEGADRTFTTTALPAATATPTPPPPAKPAKVTVSLASNKKCLKSRSTSLRVKIAKGGTVTAVEVYVNKKRVKRVTKAKDLKKSIKVSKLPKGAYTLEVRVKTKDGRTVKSSKKYRTCSSSR